MRAKTERTRNYLRVIPQICMVWWSRLPGLRFEPVQRWRTLWPLLFALSIALLSCGRDRVDDATSVAASTMTTATEITEAAQPQLQPTFTPTAQGVVVAGSERVVATTTTTTPVSMGIATTRLPPTRTPPPTATLPAPAQLNQARYQFRIGDYAAARTHLTALLNQLPSDDPVTTESRYLLARIYLAENAYAEAEALLQRIVTETVTASSVNSDVVASGTGRGTVEVNKTVTATVEANSIVTGATVGMAPPEPVMALAAKADFLQAEALRAMGQPDRAIAAYWRFLDVYPWMGEFVQPRIADAYLALGNSNGAATAYQRAVAATTDRLAKARLLEALANLYSAAGYYQEAVDAYDEIFALAQNSVYRAELHFLAGQALAGAGDLPAAIVRWRAATEEDPDAGAAYRALIELVDRDVPFDLYQRGYIDLQAEALLPAINAYQAYLDSVDATDSRVGLALAGMGQAYLRAENFSAAIITLDQVIANHLDCSCLGQAWLDKAAALAAQGDSVAARRTYRTFAREHADDPLAPEALWQSGAHALNEENQIEAAADLLRLADAFPSSERAPLALNMVAFGAYQNGLHTQAALFYERLQEDYPAYNPAGVAFWLGRVYQTTGDKSKAQAEWQALVGESPDSYYGILAAQAARELPLVAGNALNAMSNVIGPITTLGDDDGSRQYAEMWLAEWLKIGVDEVAHPPPSVADALDLQIGLLLLDLDQRNDALAVLGRLYEKNKDDPHALYALTLIYGELGAYRLSIISMAKLLDLSPAPLAEDAPIFLQKYLYPRPFADLITQEALAQGINPLLYFSLIRQESLFEEGARSFAAAQGLAQIIPDTGQWVADQLGQPEYTNDVLYRPHINLRFGAYYLAWTRDYLDGNIISALVGYNAGPGNAEFWRESIGADDPLFVELLSVNEPRIYVRAITVNLYHYTRLYRNSP